MPLLPHLPMFTGRAPLRAGCVARLLLLGMTACQPSGRPAPPHAETAGCPGGMVQARGGNGPFCMHAFEVHAEGLPGHPDQGSSFPDGSTKLSIRAAAGLVPTVGITWYQAFAACQSAGFHLCTSAEWEDACDEQPGAGGRDYPTLSGQYSPGDCSIAGWRIGKQFPLSPAGSFPACVTPSGIYDLLGNVWEWTDPGRRDALGRPVVDKRGAGHYSGDLITCQFNSVGTHPPNFEGTIGFRCCAPLQP